MQERKLLAGKKRSLCLFCWNLAGVRPSLFIEKRISRSLPYPPHTRTSITEAIEMEYRKWTPGPYSVMWNVLNIADRTSRADMIKFADRNRTSRADMIKSLNTIFFSSFWQTIVSVLHNISIWTFSKVTSSWRDVVVRTILYCSLQNEAWLVTRTTVTWSYLWRPLSL